MVQNIPLSKLIASRRNPRWVKPQVEAHRRLVASIQAFGLLEPLVVRPTEDDSEKYQVIAGYRRLAALKAVHRASKQDPKIACQIRKVDDSTADAMSLAENFVREAMHPLDEAQTFADLAGVEGKLAEAIASQFGVTPRYVRQRMKLATLAEPIQAAYRDGNIDTATAEAFAAVPEDRQVAVWQELNGNPRHAEHVRNIIANEWIDAKHALFDLAAVPESSVSRDLFSERVLVERQAFMEAQAAALDVQRQAMVEEGWSQAVVGRREDVQDSLYAMQAPDREFDQETQRKLQKIDNRRKKLEAAAEKIDQGDEVRLNRIQAKFDALETEELEIVEGAPEHFSEATKSVGTVFLMLHPDGQVRREYRVPSRRVSRGTSHGGEEVPEAGQPKPPTSEDLSDAQLADTFTHEALAVREALLDNPKARKRILAMILHEKVRSEALAIRHEANGVTLHATQGEKFTSSAFEKIQKRRADVDPFKDDRQVDDTAGYDRLCALSDKKMDALVDLLTVECITAHMLRRTEMVHLLSTELAVELRKFWRPDAAWLAGYQKIQLVHLLAELYGPTYSPDQERRKKSELVEALSKLFTDAAEGKLEDKKLSERVNRWLPSNMRAIRSPSTSLSRIGTSNMIFGYTLERF